MLQLTYFQTLDLALFGLLEANPTGANAHSHSDVAVTNAIGAHAVLMVQTSLHSCNEIGFLRNLHARPGGLSVHPEHPVFEGTDLVSRLRQVLRREQRARWRGEPGFVKVSSSLLEFVISSARTRMPPPSLRGSSGEDGGTCTGKE